MTDEWSWRTWLLFGLLLGAVLGGALMVRFGGF